jgi:hypothetical protein
MGERRLPFDLMLFRLSLFGAGVETFLCQRAVETGRGSRAGV